MTYSFSNVVSEAIENLWLRPLSGKGKEALSQLYIAGKQGDKDALYLIGRCLSGSSFISSVHGFPVDEELAQYFFDQSIQLGSAIGMLGYMRLTRKKEQCLKPPYHSMQEVFDEVAGRAEAGDAFCQMLIANAYFYEDVAYIFEEGKNALSTPAQYEKLAHQWAENAIALYESCIDQGISLVIGNLIQLYTKGEHGIPKYPHKELELWRKGAQLGDSRYEVKLGLWCSEHEQGAQAVEYFRSAYRHNNLDGLYHLGEAYTFRGCMPLDLYTAIRYVKDCLAQNHQVVGCHNMLGEIYFFGGKDVMVDYEKAFYHLQAANEEDNIWASDLLGTCYLKGLGTAPDYQKALELFEKDVYKKMSCIGIGEIYAYGLGVKQDIRSAMVYWSNYPKDDRVLANKKNFKHTLFGWKQIRSKESL